MILTFFGAISKAIKNYLTYRETRDELSLLTNRDLKDLGINRCDIEFIARKHVYGER